MTEALAPWQVRDAAHLIHPVTPPREMTRRGARVVVAGDGPWITDDRGRRIIDGFAGLWCVTVGHGREEIVAAVDAQLRTLDYFTTFHGQSHPRAIELAERLVGLFPPEWGMGHVMFSSGGSEANETNFKLVRLYWALRGEPRRTTIIARHHGYHGLTIATMTATGIMPMRWNFGPEAPGFRHVAAPYCYRCELDLVHPACGLACAKRLELAIEEEGPETVAAVIVEPVIGAGGIIPPPDGYLPTVREICDRHGILLIADEVVTGFGRTGTMFGLEHWDVRPDLVTLAKGLTSGYLPLGASVVSDEIWATITEALPDGMPFSHGYTYSGHPACCAAALANLDIIQREDLPANAASVGDHLLTRMRELERFDSVGEVRGMGLMIGIELVTDRATRRGFSRPHAACEHVEHEAWERGLYARAMGTEVVGIAPPLTIDTALADRIVEILAESIAAMEAALLPAERARAARVADRRVESVRSLFEAMPERFDRERATGTDLTARFELTGPGGGTWSVTIRDGTLSVEEGPRDDTNADVTIRASAADYLRIVNGELSGADAFAAQRLTIEGELTRAVALGELGLM